MKSMSEARGLEAHIEIVSVNLRTERGAHSRKCMAEAIEKSQARLAALRAGQQ